MLLADSAYDGPFPRSAGGPFFNLFNLGKTEAAMKELKLKEIKNGRLVSKDTYLLVPTGS